MNVLSSQTIEEKLRGFIYKPGSKLWVKLADNSQGIEAILLLINIVEKSIRSFGEPTIVFSSDVFEHYHKLSVFSRLAANNKVPAQKITIVCGSNFTRATLDEIVKRILCVGAVDISYENAK